jgi:DNA-binding transcriptional LysR family regulator
VASALSISRGSWGVHCFDLALAREDVVRPTSNAAEFVAVLEEFSTPFPSLYLYYPACRQASPASRALIDYLLQLRQAR